jgi:hypothetical protein
VVVDLDVVVDVDLAPLPDPVLIGALRQRPQRRLVELLEEAAPTPLQLLEGPVVEPLEALADGGVERHPGEEGLMPERG